VEVGRRQRGRLGLITAKLVLAADASAMQGTCRSGVSRAAGSESESTRWWAFYFAPVCWGAEDFGLGVEIGPAVPFGYE